MSMHDAIDRLIQALHDEATALDQLTAEMKARRTDFVALRPSELEAGAEQLRAPAEAAVRAASVRERAANQAASIARLRGRTTLRKIRSCAMPEQAVRLDEAGRLARDAARAARVEGRIGQRLLDQARVWRESMFGISMPKGAKVYDHRAHTQRGTTTRGSLVRGTA